MATVPKKQGVSSHLNVLSLTVMRQDEKCFYLNIQKIKCRKVRFTRAKDLKSNIRKYKIFHTSLILFKKSLHSFAKYCFLSLLLPSVKKATASCKTCTQCLNGNKRILDLLLNQEYQGVDCHPSKCITEKIMNYLFA